METRIHLLVLPYPARGHDLAALQLARKFVPYGVRITVANIFSNMSAELLDICKAEGLAVKNLGIRPDPSGSRNLPFLGHIESVQGETEGFVSSLSPSVTCILSDIFLGWTQNVADKFHIPRYVICASPAKVLAALLYTPELAAQGILPVDPSQGSQLVDIPGLLPIRKADLSPAVLSQFGLQFFEQYVYRCCQPAVEAAAGYFVNSFEDLEPTCIEALRSYPYSQRALLKGSSLRSVFPVGPLVHDAYLEPLRSHTNGRSQGPIEPETSYLRWLDKQPTASVVYVNFGSIISLSVRQIHELVLGLEASQQPFLLVVRPEDDEALPLLPESFTADARGVGFVQLQWVNQLAVLSHPAVGGFLTHCGWNSILESICRGVPLLGWPIQADQKHNCRFLVDEAHAAVEVQRGADAFVSREEVVRAVRALMVESEGEMVRANVGRLREQVKEAISKEGSVQGSIDNFLAELRDSTIPSAIP